MSQGDTVAAVFLVGLLGLVLLVWLLEGWESLTPDQQRQLKVSGFVALMLAAYLAIAAILWPLR